MNQIEFLLRLSENAQDQGDDIAKRHNEERAAHVKSLLELEKMISLARQNIHAELGRFGVATAQPQQPQQLPRAAQGVDPPMPRIAQKGPATS